MSRVKNTHSGMMSGGRKYSQRNDVRRKEAGGGVTWPWQVGVNCDRDHYRCEQQCHPQHRHAADLTPTTFALLKQGVTLSHINRSHQSVTFSHIDRSCAGHYQSGIGNIQLDAGIARWITQALSQYSIYENIIICYCDTIFKLRNLGKIQADAIWILTSWYLTHI